MPNWIMYSEYPGEGGGKAFPLILSDREKMIIERLSEDGLFDSMKEIKFVEVEDERQGSN